MNRKSHEQSLLSLTTMRTKNGYHEVCLTHHHTSDHTSPTHQWTHRQQWAHTWTRLPEWPSSISSPRLVSCQDGTAALARLCTETEAGRRRKRRKTAKKERARKEEIFKKRNRAKGGVEELHTCIVCVMSILVSEANW